MKPSSKLCLITSVACSTVANAANTNDQVCADIPYGSFQNPSVHVRPRFRYWIPDASVDLNAMAQDFTSIAEKGAGGFELLGYYLYGDYPTVIAEGGPAPTDWTKYGWGTEAWRELTKAALVATKENGLLMDFTLGPNQGAGVPAHPDDEGIMWDLLPFNVSVPIGGTFDGTIPGWGSGEFVSASTGLIEQSEFVNLSASPAFQGPYYYDGTRNTLAMDTLEDVTDQVDASGRLMKTFDSNTQGVEFQLFAYYQVRSQYQEQASPEYVNAGVPQSPVTSFVENGSRIADHFSAAGASMTINFWEQYLLGNGTRELIKEVGNYGWEDSMEFGAGELLWWTPKLLQAFEASRGYSLKKYLPLIYLSNAESNAPLASPDQYFLDEYGVGMQVVSDYWQTLTELNQIYLETLSNWTLEALESQFSAQVVYNLPMDMLANVPYVNAPETESLGFNHIIDAYRQYSGPANLAGKRVVSSELGAQRNEVYSQTWPETIWDIKRSVVGSINQFVFHGFPFSGSYPNTTYPGYTTFAYRFSNMHGPRQPSWEYYDDWMNWTARVQWVAQTGVPKIDLAFWLKNTTTNYKVPSRYESNDLAEMGFSYEYLSPDNLVRDEAIVDDGVLAPSRQAFKALVLRANDTLTVPGVQQVVKYAHQGLPIIFSGGIPQNLSGYNESGTAFVRSALDSITCLDNVHQVPYDRLGVSIQSLGITPRTRIAADRIWYTYWRDDGDTKYAFVYNDAWDSELGHGSSNGTISFETSGVPYEYDAWTGEVAAIPYKQSNGLTTVSLSLAGNQSTIIGFHNHANSSHNCQEQRKPGPAIDLCGWELTVESWAAPADLSDQTQPAKSNSTYNITSIQPWNTVSDSLRNVSGRGFYTTTFQWPPANTTAKGASLDLGAIYHTVRVWVNGQQLPPLDPTHAVRDITNCLVQGSNEVLVVVSTPLGNAMIEIYDQVRSSGTLWLGPVPEEMPYGLVQPVMLKTYY